MTATTTHDPAPVVVEQVSATVAEEGQRPTRISTAVDNTTWHTLREFFQQRAHTPAPATLIFTYGQLADGGLTEGLSRNVYAGASLWKRMIMLGYPVAEPQGTRTEPTTEEAPTGVTGSAALIGRGVVTASGTVNVTPSSKPFTEAVANPGHRVHVYLSHLADGTPDAEVLRASLPVESLFEDIADHISIGDLDVSITDPGARSLVEQFMSRLVARDRPLTEAELRRALAALDDVLPPTSGTPESDLGPFYTANALAARWGTTRQAVNKRYHRNTLLGLPTNGRDVVYPAFQFANPDRPQKHDVLPGVREVTDLITGAGEPKMVVASWLTATDPRLGGQSAIEWLRAGNDPDVVTGLARTDVKRWAT